MAIDDRCTVEVVQDPPGARLDVHLLAYLGSASSRERALGALAGAPVRVVVLEGGFPGQIGAARAFALTLGTAEYVSWVDDDDLVYAEALTQCIDHLDRHPGVVGVYTDRELCYPDGRTTRRQLGPWRALDQVASPRLITHAKVMRRAAVEPYHQELARWPTYEEFVLCGLMAERGPWHHLPIVGAVKSVRPAAESSSRLATPTLLSQAVARVAPTLMRIHRPPPGCQNTRQV